MSHFPDCGLSRFFTAEDAENAEFLKLRVLRVLCGGSTDYWPLTTDYWLRPKAALRSPRLLRLTIRAIHQISKGTGTMIGRFPVCFRKNRRISFLTISFSSSTSFFSSAGV
jgi:hypothetical protein